MALVKAFADKNFLRLNINKCEIVMFSRDQSTALPSCDVDGSILPAGDVGKCLAYWWKSDLPATKSVEENILKALKSSPCFFPLWGVPGWHQPLIIQVSDWLWMLEERLLGDCRCWAESWVIMGEVADPVHGVMWQPFSRQCWTTFWNTIKRNCSWILSLMLASCWPYWNNSI